MFVAGGFLSVISLSARIETVILQDQFIRIVYGCGFREKVEVCVCVCMSHVLSIPVCSPCCCRLLHRQTEPVAF